MALKKVVIIWLDRTFEGGHNQSMTNQFNEQIASSAASSDPIESAICHETKDDLLAHGAPVVTARTADEAIKLIESYPDAKIFFISSGSLGKDMVPEIVRRYSLIHSFYIFCFKMVDHCGWASEYVECLQMFDHPVDLLVRLMRDISEYFIKQGEQFLRDKDPHNALKYFQHSLNLEKRANERDKMKPNTKNSGKPLVQPDFRRNLDLLEGENGLIRQAERALYN
jgi:hypothetical protein